MLSRVLNFLWDSRHALEILALLILGGLYSPVAIEAWKRLDKG